MNQEINFDALAKALETFKEAIDKENPSQLERDGIIQRFGYTFELCWKSIRKLLLHLGRQYVSSSPKPLFRDAHQENLIQDVEVWFRFIDARNRTSHTYNKKTADEVYQDIQDFNQHAQNLLGKLHETLRRS